MNKYIANIKVNDKIVQLEVESKLISEAEEYFKNYIKYWGVMWPGWGCAIIVNIEEEVKYYEIH